MVGGYRGSKRVDIKALIDVILRVSDLATDYGPHIAEIDSSKALSIETKRLIVN